MLASHYSTLPAAHTPSTAQRASPSIPPDCTHLPSVRAYFFYPLLTSDSPPLPHPILCLPQPLFRLHLLPFPLSPPPPAPVTGQLVPVPSHSASNQRSTCTPPSSPIPPWPPPSTLSTWDKHQFNQTNFLLSPPSCYLTSYLYSKACPPWAGTKLTKRLIGAWSSLLMVNTLLASPVLSRAPPFTQLFFFFFFLERRSLQGDTTENSTIPGNQNTRETKEPETHKTPEGRQEKTGARRKTTHSPTPPPPPQPHPGVKAPGVREGEEGETSTTTTTTKTTATT